MYETVYVCTFKVLRSVGTGNWRVKNLQVQKLKGTGRGILCHSSISPSKQLKFDSSINSSRTDGRIKRKWYQRRISRVIIHRKRLNMCLLEEKQLKSPD